MNKPSDAAIKLADIMWKIVTDHLRNPPQKHKAMVTEIDAHTTQAVAGYKRALKECEVALRFYANREHYFDQLNAGRQLRTSIEADMGKIAKAAIAEAGLQEKDK